MQTTIDATYSKRGISRRDILRGFVSAGVAVAASRVAFGSQLAQPAPAPVRFALLGDWGSGDAAQMAIGERMAAVHGRTPFDLVVTAGDNIYPNGAADKFASHFERPFEGLLTRRVPFYACFGNHDVREGAQAQLRYPLFNMNGNNFYSFTRGDNLVEFFMLDTNLMDSRQLAWLDGALARSTARWKVPVFHHAIYSSGAKHGSDTDLRKLLEPAFVRHGVRVAFSGHDHIYQRTTVQQGVQYFVSGAGGKIRKGNLEYDALVAKGYDEASHFMVLEVDDTKFSFRAVTSAGETVDEGTIAATSTETGKAAAA
jgi:3',5'-cyclic AMP phosphodiesterase CpdA